MAQQEKVSIHAIDSAFVARAAQEALGMELHMTEQEIHHALDPVEPNVSPSAVAALWAPTGGIVCPFGMTVALGENAIQNGVEFRLGTRVSQVRPGEKGAWLVITEKETLVTRAVVNAAGVCQGGNGNNRAKYFRS